MQPNNTPSNTVQPQQPTTPAGPDNSYDFITNPKIQPKKSFLSGADTAWKKILAVLVVIIVVLFLFSFVRGLLSGGSDKDAFLNVSQHQQVIIVLSQEALKNTKLSADNKGFSLTASSSIGSDQLVINKYLRKNKVKINAKVLNKQVSSTTLTKLKNADINNTYNETYQAVMKQELKSYQNSLQQAYVKTKNVAGKKVLTKDYDSAELLLKMLPATTN
ncbi:MAG: hypothetical protein WCK80_02200 [bacterium]